jgi:undecaprenyl-phosphate galactose phosphotransferase
MLVNSSWRLAIADPLTIVAKRIADVVITGVALVALAPFLLVLAALIRCDGGPALFGHVRLGANGRPFRCLKFRTMVIDAEARLAATLASNPGAALEWALTRRLTDDPRVTPIGRFLRLTSLDELPQLWNVLRGEISLVGPRPILAEDVPLDGRNINYYYETRPGVTGLWQVSGRSDATFKRRVELDVWYVKNWTGWNDLAIIRMTFAAVLGRKGAR